MVIDRVAKHGNREKLNIAKGLPTKRNKTWHKKEVKYRNKSATKKSQRGQLRKRGQKL